MDYARLTEVVKKYDSLTLNTTKVKSIPEFPYPAELVLFEMETKRKIITTDSLDQNKRAYYLFGALYTGGKGISAKSVRHSMWEEASHVFVKYLTDKKEYVPDGHSQIFRLELNDVEYEETNQEPTDLGFTVNMEYTKQVGEINIKAKGTIFYEVPKFLLENKSA